MTGPSSTSPKGLVSTSAPKQQAATTTTTAQTTSQEQTAPQQTTNAIQEQQQQASGSPQEQVLEVDPLLHSKDVYSESAYSSGPGSDTTSLAQSVLDYQYENGRRFHGLNRGKYNLPNDEKEQDRLDLQNHAVNLAFSGKLFCAPLEKNPPQRALDIGTGTGIWAMDLADWFPQCEVVGLDLSPIQPNWVPPNMRFEIDDIEEPWGWEENSIDYIHIRDMSYSTKKWDHIFESAFKALKPGGYLEIQDWKELFRSDDNTVPPTSPVAKWRDALNTAVMDVLGMPYITLTKTAPARFAAHGLVDFQMLEKKLPFGPWPKDKKQKYLGLVVRQWAMDTADGALFSLLTRCLGWEWDDCVKLQKEVERELMDRDVHAYNSFAFCWARKPGAGEGGV